MCFDRNPPQIQPGTNNSCYLVQITPIKASLISTYTVSTTLLRVCHKLKL